MNDPTLSKATRPDPDPLLAMQTSAMRSLGARSCAGEAIEAALAHLGTIDPRLLGEGTDFLMECGGRIVGSAGWSRAAPNYARLMAAVPALLSGRSGPVAKVRSVFVHPEATRRGIGTALIRHVEAAMRAEGIARAELMATPSGVPLHEALGYRTLSAHEMLLPDGLRFPMRRMVQPLAGDAAPGVQPEAA